MAEVATANAAETSPKEQTGDPAAVMEAATGVHEQQQPKRDDSSHAVSCDQTTSVPITSQPGPVVSCDVPISVPTSAIEPPNAPNLKPERTKDRLSENEEEGDSEGGEGDSSSRRRRRRHSSASEDRDEEDDEGEELDESGEELHKETSHPSEEEGEDRQQDDKEDEDIPQQPQNDPTYVPTKGGFYLHDDRFADAEEQDALKHVPEPPKQRTEVNDRWTHDLYVESEQGPRGKEKEGGDSYERERRPARRHKLGNFVSEADQKKLSQRRGEGNWSSRRGQGYGRPSGKRGGRGQARHWDSKGKERVPPKGESGERGNPVAAPTASSVHEGEGQQVGENKGSGREKDMAEEEWPDFQTDVGGKGDRRSAQAEGEHVPPGDNTRVTEVESKEKPEPPKTVQDDKEFSVSDSKREGAGDSTHAEHNAKESRQGAHGENRRGGGRQGSRRPYDDNQRQSNRHPSEDDRRYGNRRMYEDEQRKGIRRQYEDEQRKGTRRQYEDEQRQKRSGHSLEDKGGKQGDVRGERRSGTQQGERGRRGREDGVPRGGGRYREGHKRDEWSQPQHAAEQSNSHAGSVKGVTSKAQDAPPQDLLPAYEEGSVSKEVSRPVDSGKSRSLFHTGEPDSAKQPTKMSAVSSEEGIQRPSVRASSRGVGRGRGWKERLEAPKEQASTVGAAVARSGAQKSTIKVIESLEQRLLSDKGAVPAAAAIPLAESTAVIESPPKDREEADAWTVPTERSPAAGKSSNLVEEEGGNEGTQGTKPKRYSSRRQQKSGESGDMLGSEDIIPPAYGPGNPLVPMPFMDPHYQAYLAHQMQQMKLMMSHPTVMIPQHPPPMVEMGYPPPGMPYMFPTPHGYWPLLPPPSGAPSDPYPAMVPPPAPMPISGMEEGGGLPSDGGAAVPSFVPLPMSSLFMPQVTLDQQRTATHSPSHPVAAKPRSQAIPIVSPPPPPQQLQQQPEMPAQNT